MPYSIISSLKELSAARLVLLSVCSEVNLEDGLIEIG